MSRCKKCGFENKDGSKFCGHCGAPLKTRSSGKGIIIGVCIVLVMVGITVAVLFLTGRSQQTDIELPIFSKRIWDYDGTIYTSYDVEHTGWTSLTGDDHLYYVALDSSMQSKGTIVDLSDLSVADSEDYQIKAADANTWILCGIKGAESDQLFQCNPGFENIKELDITKDTFMGIYDGKIYFQTYKDGEYNVQTYDMNSGDITSVLECWSGSAVLSGSDLFSAEKSRNVTTLHRMELGANGDEYGYGYGYDYSLIYIDVDMKGSFYEVDNKVYLTGCWQGKGKNNTEVIALDLQSGKYEPIGNCTNTEI